MYMQAHIIFSIVAVLITLTGCASMQEAGDGSGTHALPFLQVKAAPDSLKGQVVVFGGNVLTGRRLKDGTRIEILQLPLDRTTRPVYDLTQSQGRFIAFQPEFLDPATLPPGTRVTVTGESPVPSRYLWMRPNTPIPSSLSNNYACGPNRKT